MPYLDWLPMIVCVILAFIWLVGCTLTTSSSATQQDVSTAGPRPQMTITVRPPMTVTPLPTRQPPARIAVQPTAVSPPDTYTVEEDDTLLEIALAFDLTVEELIAANPGVDPLALQIGQELMIPRDGVAPAGVQQPPPPLPLMAPSCYPTTTDSLVCLGLVENDQPQAAEQVAVVVELNDRDGNALASGETLLEQMFVPPGGRAPYRVLFRGIEEAQVAGVVAVVSGGTLSGTVPDRFVAVTVEQVETYVRGRLYTLQAELVNATDAATAPPRVVLTVLDESGTVHGYRVWDAPTSLQPGERLPFSLSVLPLGLNGNPPTDLTYMLHIEAPRLSENE